jgi:hypothetical protein
VTNTEETPIDGGAELTGVDLARFALRNAREASRKRSGQPPAKRQRTIRRPSGVDGREPISLAASISRLISERAWEAPVAGGGVLNGWPRIVPELAGHVQAVAFDPSAGLLDLLPASPAYATQVRLMATVLITRLNADPEVGGVVRNIRALPPGYVATPRPAEEGSEAAARPRVAPGVAAEEPTRCVLSQPGRTPLPPPPGGAKAIERQTAEMTREPGAAFREAQVQAEENQERSGGAGEDLYRRARERARAARAARHAARPIGSPDNRSARRT